ncbi:uncharacterized protein LOC124411948 isoform X2 [Diprion similis]|uniref:uncharacterized protein LOC124411948 isoform X2 n=1 Tax=Diprion similis TaxID=362088 RepID=UPI001EF83F48|nr:uncharacterized protein LOC124411948 isoform X2 [Diprion similis]
MDTLQGRFLHDSMLCLSCGESRETIGKRLNLSEYKIEGNISRLDCTICGKFVAMNIGGDVINLDGVIDGDRDDTWLEAKTGKEKIIYYALCQIIYLERDSPREEKYESVFAFADESDLVMLRWKNGRPIGFFTLKQKGTKIFPESEVEYAMPMLDTAYIRSEYRGNGIGTEIITKITGMFPDEDIGFSRPISDGMSKGFIYSFICINRLIIHFKYVITFILIFFILFFLPSSHCSLGEIFDQTQRISFEILGNHRRR